MLLIVLKQPQGVVLGYSMDLKDILQLISAIGSVIISIIFAMHYKNNKKR